jgi:hypothetical protein
MSSTQQHDHNSREHEAGSNEDQYFAEISHRAISLRTFYFVTALEYVRLSA